MIRRPLCAGTVLGVMALAACSADQDATPPTTAQVADVTSPTTSMMTTEPPSATTTATSTTSPAVPSTTILPTTVPTTTVPTTTAPVGSTAEEIVRILADDSLTGRDNLTLGGRLAREAIVDELSSFAEPLTGLDGFEQAFPDGVNVLGVIPGTDLADEYVFVGGHYDHLTECRDPTPDDVICNGAADNATGVAAALTIGRRIAASAPRRSVVIALWDAEEDGLLGSRFYVANPVVPLDATIVSVNFDLIGSNLLPSLATTTLRFGAETGGEALVAASTAAADEIDLDVIALSDAFGQGRSDHAPFAAAGVPIVYFGDATNGCYHSVDDEPDRVDFGKLEQQIAIGEALVAELVNTDEAPEFDSERPVVAFSDAVALRDLVAAAEPDHDLLDIDDAGAPAVLARLDAIVAAGPDEFDDADVGAVLGDAARLIEALAATRCP